MILTVSEYWKELLRHMLGATRDHKKSQHGFRNRFCAEIGSDEHRSMLDMMKAGLVGEGCTINSGRDVMYYATREGCAAIGLDPAAVKRAMEA